MALRLQAPAKKPRLTVVEAIEVARGKPVLERTNLTIVEDGNTVVLTMPHLTITIKQT